MTNRTVKVDLVAGTVGYDAPIRESAKTTTELALAQKQAAAAAKASSAETVAGAQAIAIAEKQAAAEAKAAAVTQVSGDEAVAAAKREAAAAAKEAAAQEKAGAKAVAAAQKEVTVAAREVAAAEKAVQAEQFATAKAETAAAKAAEDAAKTRSEAYTETGKKMMTAGLGLVAAFGVAEKATSDFEKSMSGVQAVANAAPADLNSLRVAALAAGKDTAFSAKEAADAEGELVRAGVSVKDVLGGALAGTLNLAAAGQLSLADAAVISANAMNTFALKGADVGHIADVLAAGANKSAADVKELSYGLQQGGLVAAQTGLTLEDTTAVLAAFADRGLKGADAGTSMKTMLERLNNPTVAARDLMNSLGIAAYDTSGKFVGIQAVAGQLHDKLGGLTDAQRNQTLATIFGSDAIRGATVLYSLGADGVKGYTQAVNDQGAAGRMASEQLNNLSGDLHQLKGSLDTALIQSGGGANSVLRDMTQTVTGLVNAFASLPKPVQEAVTGFAGGAGTALLLVGGLTSIAGKAAATSKSLTQVAQTAEGMRGVLAKAGAFMAGPWGIAIAGAAAVAAIFISKMHDSKIEVADFTSAIKEDGTALGDHTVAMVTSDLASKKLYDSFGKLGVSADTVTKAAMGNADAMNQVVAATAKALKGADDINKIASGVSSLNQIQAIAAGLHDQLHAQQQATAATAAATVTTAQATATTAEAEQQSKKAAGAQMQQAGAARALADATTAKNNADYADTAAVKTKTTATTTNTTVTNAATSAKHAQTAADKSGTLAARDAGKAVNDHSKAVDAASKAQSDGAKTAAANADALAKAADKTKAQADAANVNAAANASAADKHKANAAAAKASADAHAALTAANKANTAATHDAAAATRTSTTAANADIRASDAAATAADKASRAHDAAAKAVDKKAAAAQKAAKVSAEEAAAQQAAAEAAQMAADEHAWGTVALKGWADAAAHASDNAYKLDNSVAAEVGAMKSAKDTANGLRDALDALNGVHIAASKAAIDVQSKIAGLNKTLHENGTTLDITTEKGRTNMSAVLDLAQAINAHAQSVTEETGSVKAGNDALAASRDEFDKVLQKAGLSKQKIDDFNKSLLNTPVLSIDVDATKAMDKLRKLKDAWGQALFITPQGVKQQLAHGGLVTGPGTDTSDSVDIRASRDEYILNAAATRRIGVASLNAWNFGGAPAVVVKPQMIASVGGTTPQASAPGGAPLHIEHYYESSGGGAQQTAAELSWLLHARGIAA